MQNRDDLGFSAKPIAQNDFSEDEGEEEFLSALPPPPPTMSFSLSAQDSNQPSLVCLDEMVNDGSISLVEAAVLKEKFNRLQEGVLASQRKQSSLLTTVEGLSSIVEDQRLAESGSIERWRHLTSTELRRLDLERHRLEELPASSRHGADSFPVVAQHIFKSVDGTEAERLRLQLFYAQNELLQYEGTMEELDFMLETLRSEKAIIAQEVEICAKEPQKKKEDETKLMKEIEALKEEVVQLQKDCSNIREELNETNRINEFVEREAKFTKERKQKKEAQQKEEQEKQERVDKDFKRLTDENQRYCRELERIVNETNDKKNEIENLRKNEESLRNEKESWSDKSKQTTKEKETEDDFLSDKKKDWNQLEADMKIAESDRKRMEENLKLSETEIEGMKQDKFHLQRDVEIKEKALEKLKLKMKIAKDALEQIEDRRDKLKYACDCVPRSDSAADKRKKLMHEVESARRSLMHQGSVTEDEEKNVHDARIEERHLLAKQEEMRAEVIELARIETLRADEREERSRDVVRAQMQLKRTGEDLKMRIQSIKDQEKKYKEMRRKNLKTAKLYEEIKKERNKYVKEIQKFNQAAVEMRDKTRHLQNELEICNTLAQKKERQLQKHKQRLLGSHAVRDSLRNDRGKLQQKQAELKDARDEQRSDLKRWNTFSDELEREIMEMQRQFEEEKNKRDEKEKKLLEAKDELQNQQEKQELLDSKSTDVEESLFNQEEEIRFFQLEKSLLTRSIDLDKKLLPQKTEHRKEILTLKTQLNHCHEMRQKLENMAETPNEGQRWRLKENQGQLPVNRPQVEAPQEKLVEKIKFTVDTDKLDEEGKEQQNQSLEEETSEKPQSFDEARNLFFAGRDPDAKSLQRKIASMVAELEKKEETLMEKEVLMQQVDRLNSRLQTRLQDDKQETLNLTRSINELQRKIQSTTRKMMGSVSELAMQQGEAMNLQTQVKEKEEFVRRCYKRLEDGQSPCDQFEKEWEDELRRRKTNVREEEEEREKNTAAIVTRPNAYVPCESRGLEVPRPYGGHAPFMPQEPGANFRHIKKPTEKPIEI